VFAACVKEVRAERCHARRVWPTVQLTPVLASRLEKVAIDNGFDRELSSVGSWLTFASTQCPLQIWLTMAGGGECYAALSQFHVANPATWRRSVSRSARCSDAPSTRAPCISTLENAARRTTSCVRTTRAIVAEDDGSRAPRHTTHRARHLSRSALGLLGRMLRRHWRRTNTRTPRQSYEAVGALRERCRTPERVQWASARRKSGCVI
jgi:hypothetical protein